MIGPQHRRIAASIPVLLRRGGAAAEASLLEQNALLFANSMTSPDFDLKNVKIPTNKFPIALRGVASSFAPVWEHVIVPDMPSWVTAFLRDVVCGQILHRPFMYADGAIVAWYNLALARWASNDRVGPDGALYHLARCCHLIQDLSIPHHTTVFGNIKEVYNALLEKSSIQTAYENYCNQQYTMSSGTYNLAEYSGITLPAFLINEANATRGNMYLCDGITLPSWLRNSIFRDLLYKLNKAWKEDFYTVAQYSNSTAEKNSVLLVHKFFRDVNF